MRTSAGSTGSGRNPIEKQTHQEAYQKLCALLAGRAGGKPWDALSQEDWQILADTARAEGVAGLTYWKLRGRQLISQVPAAALDALKSEFYNTAANNRLLYQELNRILKAFHQAGIRLAILKGAALAVTIYPDPALRPMGDLDLLVSEDDLDAAIEAATGLGFSLEGALRGLDSDLRRRIHCEVNFSGGERIPVHLELHWSLIGGRESRYSPDMAWFWAQTEPLSLPGEDEEEPALTLNPTAHLLYLIAHLILKHGAGEDSLRWYYDLHSAMILWGKQIHWDELLAQASAFHWEGALGPALSGIAQRFGTSLPGEVAAYQQSPRDEGSRQSGRTPFGKTLEDLALLRWGGRLRLFLALIFPSRETILWRYRPKPAWLWPFYYPYRWWGMLKAGIAHIYQILKKAS